MTSALFRNERIVCVATIALAFICIKCLANDILRNTAIATKGRKTAVVYARLTFHEEVVNSICCTLHDLGYLTIVYIGSGVHINGYAIPYVYQNRKEDSARFFGGCVDSWVVIPIGGPVFQPNENAANNSAIEPYTISVKNIPQNTDLVVFTTFPMMLNINTFDVLNKFKHIKNTDSKSLETIVPDSYAMSILEYMKNSAKASKAIFVVHRVTDIVISTQVPHIQSKLGNSRSSYLFVSQHTHNFFLNLCKSNHSMTTDGICQGNIDFFYSVPRLQSKSRDEQKHIINQRIDMKEDGPGRSAIVTFAVQGRFGGKYSDRRDPSTIISCLQKIENLTIMLKMRFPDVKSNISISITFIGNNFYDQKSRSRFGQLQTGSVSYISRLKYNDYYSALASARFIVPGLSNTSYKQYATVKATSTVPIALAVGVPIVASTDFLLLYPCLADALIHKRISGATECDSMMNAILLSKGDYNEMRREARNCSTVFSKKAKSVFY